MSSGNFSSIFSNNTTKNPASSGLQSGSLFGSSQSAPANKTGLFGSSNPTSSSGSLFGSSNTNSNTGGLFGSSNTNSNTGGLFGSSNTNSNTGGLFGSSNTNSNTGGLFGSSNTNSNTGGLFGSSNTNSNTGGLFGSSNTNSNTGGLFGSSNTNSNTGGLFGSSNTNSNTGGLFGSSNTKPSSGGLFGSSNSASGSGGLFSSSNTGSSTGSLFGSTSSGLFGSSNAKSSTGGLFGSIDSQTKSSTADNNCQNLNSVENRLKACLESPLLYGNQKDSYILRLNQIKAFHGNGRVFCAQNSFCDLSEENYECAFKTIVYNQMPECELFENILTFHLNANYETLVRDDLSNFKKTLLSIILGKSVSDDVSSSSQVPLTICVKNILQLSEKTCTVDFYIMQQQSSQSAAATPRDTANQPGLHTVSGDTLLSFFNQASNAEKLKNQLGVYEIQDKSKITKTDIRNYLNSCPAGIDKIEWQNACKNNPDQSKYLPVVLYGFEELRNRCLVHLNEKKNQIELIKQIKNRLSAIKQMNSTNSASIANFKTKLLTINKRFMNFLCKIQSLNNSTQTILVYEDESFMKITQLHDRVKNNLYNYSLLCENLDNNLGTNASSNMIRGNSSDDPQTNQNYKRILATLKDQQDKLSQLSVKYSDFNLA